MSTQRVSSVKIPVFDKENYGLWKKKMMLFLQVANPKYLGVLKNGPKIPMVIVAESIENNIVVSAARTYPKDPADYTADEKEDASLDINLQLILVESLDPIMYNHVVNCKDAKHIWETIETINEGTEEVRENRLEILTSEYEHFKSTSGEGISEVFERYNKLINKLNLQGKFYTQKEINRKFLLTLPTHLEHRITAIRESRDMNEVSLERLYGVLKTYELEQIQQKEIYGKGRVVSATTALVAEVPQRVEEKIIQSSGLNLETITAEYGITSPNQSDGDFYSLEELEQLKDESMALIVKRFGKFRFRRNPNFKFKTNINRFQRGGSSTSNSSRGGYRTGMVDRSKIRCFNCNELGHFATECKKPRQFKNTSYDVSQKKKSGKAYLAEGKSWDDSESEDEEVGNLALMAISDNPSSSKPQVTFTDTEMIYHLSGTLDCARRENDRIILQNTALEKEVSELRTVHINQDKLKQEIVILENRVNLYKQLETNLKVIITDLETKVRGYYNSTVKAKEIFNQQAISQTVGIGFDYNEAVGKLSINSPNRVSAKERGIPHVLKGVDKPLFRKSIAEPFNETSIFIQEELRTEDRLAIDAMSSKSVSVDPVKVVLTTETVSDTDKLEQKDNMHNMPKIVISHEACGVANCMSCAFNVMYAYFNSKHASSDKTAPRQHLNSKKHVKSKTVSVNHLNNMKHAKGKGFSPQQLNLVNNVKSKTASLPKSRMETSVPKPKQKSVEAVYKVKKSVDEKVNAVESKTASSPKSRVKTFPPKPKQKVVKATYKVKCSVSDKTDSVKSDNNVKPDKNQFFKFAGPNQVWVPKKV